MNAFSFALGGLPTFLGMLALVALMWVRHSETDERSRIGLLRIGTFPLLILGCFFVMISRHPPIMHMVTEPTIYLYPFQPLCILFVACSAWLIVNRRAEARICVQVCLLVLTVTSAGTVVIGEMSRDRKDRTSQVSHLMLKALRSKTPLTTEQLNDPVLGSYYREINESKVYESLGGQRQGK